VGCITVLVRGHPAGTGGARRPRCACRSVADDRGPGGRGAGPVGMVRTLEMADISGTVLTVIEPMDAAG
jgi:hypothetical protein